MYACPICHGEVVPDSKNPGMYLCYNCKKRMPEDKLEMAGGADAGVPDAVSMAAPTYANMGEPAYGGYSEPNAYAQPQYAPSQPYADPNYGGQPAYEPEPPKKKGGNGLGIATLILGIVTLLTSLVPFLGILAAGFFGLITLILGIIAIIKASKRPFAIIGIVLAIVAVAVSFASTWFGTVAVIEQNGGNINAIMEAAENGNDEAINEMLNELGENMEASINEEVVDETDVQPADNPQQPQEPQPEARNVHGIYVDGLYTNELFGVTITNGGGTYELLSDPDALFDIRAIMQADRANTLTANAEDIASPDLDSYYNSRMALDMGGAEIRNIMVGGREVPALVKMNSYPDGVTEWEIVVAKIVDGCQFDLTAIANSEEAAYSMFNAVTQF